MATKKNLPNIPIYIGDWERDCNVLSLESEAAWMRIVFKLWTKGKQNSIKIPAKSLQNLWRCGPAKMSDILQDLIYNDICTIGQDEAFVTFTCRRFVKENKLSEIRSDAAKGGKEDKKKKGKGKEKTSKHTSKKEQNTDNDFESVNDFKINYDIKSVNDLVKSKNLDFEVDMSKLMLKIDSWKENGWIDGYGKKIKNLKSKILGSLTYMKLEVAEGKKEFDPIADGIERQKRNAR